MDASPIKFPWGAALLAQIHKREDEAEVKEWDCACRSCTWARERLAAEAVAAQPKRQRTPNGDLYAARQEELERSYREVSDDELDRRALAMNASEGR